MKGLLVEKAGGDYVLSEVQKPTPDPKQVLVKSLYAALNPVCACYFPDILPLY
jgi:NADPH:quinone reductase-like Zn-dependent oxidoreductase